MRAHLIPALCLGAAVLAAASAHAERTERTERPEAQARGDRGRPEAQARNLYQESQRLEREGHLTEALGRLREAYALLPTPTLLLPIARLCEQLKQPLAGLEATRRLRKQLPAAGREAAEGAAELDRIEARLQAQVARLRVRTDLAGALVIVDGREVGRSPLDAPVEVDPGVHEVEVRGARSARLPQVEVGPGEEREAEVRTAPEPPPAPVATPAPTPPKEPAPAPRPARYRPGAPTWIGVGLTGAALLAAGAVSIAALALRNQLAPRCDGGVCYAGGDDSIAALNEEVGRANTLSRLSPVLLGVAGGVAAATVVVGLVEWRVRAGRADRRVALAPGAFGLTFGFTFGGGP